MCKRVTILKFLEVLRSASNIQTEIYTSGGCYRLFELLQAVFPGASPYYNGDHVVTKIGNAFYDISGVVCDKGYIPMERSQQIEAARSSRCNVIAQRIEPEAWK
jgi:hypothetical protein